MPRKFRFRLEPVLRYRKHLEEEKRRALGRARQAVYEQNRLLLGLLQDEARGKGDFAAMKREPALAIGRLRLQEQYLNSVARRIRREYERLQLLDAGLARDLGALLKF